MEKFSVLVSKEKLLEMFDKEFQSYEKGVHELGRWQSQEAFLRDKNFFLKMIDSFIDSGVYSEELDIEKEVDLFIHNALILEFDDVREDLETDEDLISRLQDSFLFVDVENRLCIECF